MKCAWPGVYHSLNLTRIQYHSPQVTPHTNPVLITSPKTLKQLPLAREWHNSRQSGVIIITVKLVVLYREKLCSVQEEQLLRQNTSLRHPWHHVNQFATTTIHHDILWPIREKLRQNRQHWTSNSHRTELEENPLMVDPVKSGVDLNYCSLLPHLQCTL